MSHQLTIDQFKSALPDHVKKSFNQDLIDQINQTLSDPDMFELYRDNMIGFAKVVTEGRFKLSQYIDAVKYVSHKMMGCTNIDAYTKTFPQRHAQFMANGTSGKDIASYVTAYAKGKLVNLVFAQSMIPLYVTNADVAQKAVNVLAELMISANSEKVRSDSANALLTHLKVPEVTKVQLDIGVKDDGGVIEKLRAATQALSAQQRLAMQSGAMNAQQVAHSRLVIDQDAEIV